MAHAAPTPGGMTGPGTIGGPSGTTGRGTFTSNLPDIFDARVHRVAKIAIPVVLGLVYGYWAAANRRSGGPITGWNLLFGFVTALAFIVLCLAVARFAPLLKRELHSLVKSGFAGAALGFLYSQTGESVLRSAAIGLATTAAVFLVFFYRYYTREDGEGNRIR
ncbi:hypothetical protein OG226_25840 [Streptomyces sp. NBC_01261]|uniref:hypothetical protein n=1 Tax=unclassified Streptomyces TaxID=2593676 RepID=UPI002E2C128C|nr:MULTISPECIES: hypothetical protein [unclassified Streptomyces]